MLRRLGPLLVGVSMLAIAAALLGTSEDRRPGPAPMDLLFIDPATGLPPLLFDPGTDQRDQLIGLATAAPAYVGGILETILRAEANIDTYDFGLRVAFDHDQIPNPIVAGYYYDTDGGEGTNGVLVKFNAQGETAYESGVHIGQYEVLYGVGVDGDGNAIGGGYMFDFGTSSYKFLAAKVNSAGDPIWTRTFAVSPTSIYNIALDAAVDSAGNAILGGYSLGAGFDYDVAVAKLDPNGNVLWAKRVDVPVAGSEYIWGIAIDSAGNLVLGGS
ncbi:MAG: hypothetical protein ACRDH5_10600, partial [bacterium]